MELLKQAKKIKSTKDYKDRKQMAELSIAWLLGDVTYSQVAGIKSIRGSAYSVLALGLREAYRLKKIKIIK